MPSSDLFGQLHSDTHICTLIHIHINRNKALKTNTKFSVQTVLDFRGARQGWAWMGLGHSLLPVLCFCLSVSRAAGAGYVIITASLVLLESCAHSRFLINRGGRWINKKSSFLA